MDSKFSVFIWNIMDSNLTTAGVAVSVFLSKRIIHFSLNDFPFPLNFYFLHFNRINILYEYFKLAVPTELKLFNSTDEKHGGILIVRQRRHVNDASTYMPAGSSWKKMSAWGRF